MLGILFRPPVPQDEFEEQYYRGLLMDDDQEYRGSESFVPYDEEFMLSPEELEYYRILQEQQVLSGVGRMMAPKDESMYRTPNIYGPINRVMGQGGV
jgi:hypothetical protein